MAENQDRFGKGSPRGAQKSGGGSKRPGPGGFCICPKCGKKIPHQQGTPCYGIMCPECGTALVRER